MALTEQQTDRDSRQRTLKEVRADNITKIIREYDFVIDATDNFGAKFLINDAGHRCIFHWPPPAGAVPSCSEAGVLGPLQGVIDLLQATEAIKFLLVIGDLLTNTLLVYNALEMGFHKVKVNRNPQCPLCGRKPKITELRDEQEPICDLR